MTDSSGEIFKIPQSALLAADVGIGEIGQPTYPESGCVIDAPEIHWPTDDEDLNDLVDQTLTPILGVVPDRDDGGDIAFVNGTTVVFVSTLSSQAALKVWAVLVLQASDRDHARLEVAILNREYPFTKFRLVDDRIVAEMYLLASPFVPAHLAEAFTLMCAVTEGVEGDLAPRVRGRRFLDPGDAGAGDGPVVAGGEVDHGDHTAMMTLLQLDAEQPGSVTPPMAAHICDSNRQLLLRLITWNEEQEIEWRTARDDALSAEDPDVCEQERLHAERTVTLLREALRHVIEQATWR